MKRIAVWLILLSVVMLVVFLVYHGYTIANEPNSRLYPWSVRRDSVARPALPDHLTKVASSCPSAKGTSASLPSEMRELHLFLHFSGFPPEMPTPPDLADLEASADLIVVEWLPLIYMDASDRFYRVYVRALLPQSEPLPLKAQVAFPGGTQREAEAPPYEAESRTGRKIFLSDCWRGGRFSPPPNWKGSAAQIAWQELDWVVLCTNADSDIFWVAPVSGQQYVYLRVLRDIQGRVKQAIVSFVQTPERRYELTLISSDGTRVVEVSARKMGYQPLHKPNYTLYLLRGEKISL